MANYSELLNDINAAIYENNDQEIDALEVRAILREMVTSLGSGFLFKGIATPSSPSGTGTYEPDQNVFYLATTAGTYTYLGGLVVAAGEVAFLCFDGTWTKKSSALLSTGSIVDNTTTDDATKPLSAKQGKVLADAGAATSAEVSALGQKFYFSDIPWLNHIGANGGTSFPTYQFNAKTISCPLMFRTIDFVSNGKIKFGDENTGTNVVWYAVKYFDADKKYAGRGGYSATPEIAINAASYPYFSISLGLHDAANADIGGNVEDYGVDKIFMRANPRNTFVAPFSWKDSTYIKTSLIHSVIRGTRLETPILKVKDFAVDGLLSFLDVNPYKYHLRYYYKFFDANYNVLLSTNPDFAPFFSIPANSVYFQVQFELLNESNTIQNASSINGENILVQVPGIPFDGLNGLDDEKIVSCAILSKTIGNINPQLVFQLGGGGTVQSIACYGGKLFRFYNGNEYVYVHDAATGALLQTITMPNPSTQIHNNSVAFGTEKYDSADTFPLLYASQENANQNKCLVYRITGAENNYAFSVVQEIIYPTRDETGMYLQNCYIDTFHGYLLLSGHSKSTVDRTPTNKIKYYLFQLPALSAGNITLTLKDVLKQSKWFLNMPCTQGGICKDGILYQVFGIDALTAFMMFDIDAMDFVARCVLSSEVLNNEPEGVYIYNDKIHLVFSSKAVYLLNP